VLVWIFWTFARPWILLIISYYYKDWTTCGLFGTEICWFMGYLTYRFQHVKCANSYSSWGLWYSLGKCLRSPVILIYVNGMSSLIIHGKLLQYADDTALICIGLSIDKLVSRLSHLLLCIKQSKMQLNSEKSSLYSVECITFRSKGWQCTHSNLSEISGDHFWQ